MEGKWKGFMCYYTSIHRATLRKRNQNMFRCDTETYFKNHTISVSIKKEYIILVQFSRV